MTDYLVHWDLNAPPFDKEIRDHELWLPKSKEQLVAEVRDAVLNRRSVLLTGDPGVGKTCVMRALRHSLPQNGYRLTYFHNATLGRRDFYRQLCLGMGLTPKATAAAVFHSLTTHIQELSHDQTHPVFLLDEAHLLHQDTLDHLHILMNYDWDSRALLSLVMVGLVELEDRLKLRRNRSLYTRMHHRLRIEPLTPDDTAEYLRVRLGRVGCDRDIFAYDAVALLHEGAAGTLRELDRRATHALKEAAVQGRKRVERDIVSLTSQR